jgi:hypothetical protein
MHLITGVIMLLLWLYVLAEASGLMTKLLFLI